MADHAQGLEDDGTTIRFLWRVCVCEGVGWGEGEWGKEIVVFGPGFFFLPRREPVCLLTILQSV